MKAFEGMILLTIVFLIGLGEGFLMYRVFHPYEAVEVMEFSQACENSQDNSVDVKEIPPIFKLY